MLYKNDWVMSTGLNLSFPIFSGMALSTQSQQAKLAYQKQETTTSLRQTMLSFNWKACGVMSPI